MSRQKAIALAMAVVMSTIVLSCIQDAEGATDADPEPTPASYTFYGYVATIDQEDNKPLSDVAVELYNMSKELVDTCETDENGRFEFTVKDYDGNNAHFIKLEYSEYAVRAHPNMTSNSELDDGDYFPFTLDSSKLDSEGKYALTGTADSRSSILMAITVGDIYGSVYGDVSGVSTGLNGAKIVLVSTESGKNYSTTTDDKGYFSIKCPYGTYKMSVSCNGFESATVDSVSTSGALAYIVNLDKVRADVIFGLDNAHSMMLVGFVILVLMLAITISLARWSRKPNAPIQIENDLELPKTDDDLRDL